MLLIKLCKLHQHAVFREALTRADDEFFAATERFTLNLIRRYGLIADSRAIFFLDDAHLTLNTACVKQRRFKERCEDVKDRLKFFGIDIKVVVSTLLRCASVRVA